MDIGDNTRKSVLDILRLKHPPAQPISPDALSGGSADPPTVPPVVFDQITASSIRSAALDKCPGIRPIGICETPRRIIAKVVLLAIKGDLQEATGSLQLCAGQISGIEAAVH